MHFNSEYHHRKSIRIPGYDYSQEGYYFITICTDKRECIFGEVVSGRMNHSPLGLVADHCWRSIPFHFPHVQLDEYIIMPNHIHGILKIVTDPHVGANNHLPLHERQHYFGNPLARSLASFIRGFKIGVTKWHKNFVEDFSPWQKNFYESVIWNEDHLPIVRQYIKDNPKNWYADIENPDFTNQLSKKDENLRRKEEYSIVGANNYLPLQ